MISSIQDVMLSFARIINSTNIRLKAFGDKIKSFSFPLKELKNKSIADMPLSHSGWRKWGIKCTRRRASLPLGVERPCRRQSVHFPPKQGSRSIKSAEQLRATCKQLNYWPERRLPTLIKEVLLIYSCYKALLV